MRNHKANPARSGAVTVIAFCLLMSACADSDKADAELADSDERSSLIQEAVERDEFLVADGQASTLAASQFVADLAVDSVEPVEGYQGAVLVTGTLIQTYWGAGHIWDMGEKLSYSAPERGSQVVLLGEESWGLNANESYLVAVSDAWPPSEFPTAQGFLQVAIDQQGEFVSHASDDPMTLVVAGKSGHVPPGQLVRLVKQASQWIDDVNETNTAREQLGQSPIDVALPAELTIAGTDQNEASDPTALWMSQDPEYRQLPIAEEELPGLAAELKLVPVTIMFTLDNLQSSEAITFVGLRFEGLGVLGPWSVDQANGYTSLTALVPAGKIETELLLWTTETGDPGEESSYRFAPGIVGVQGATGQGSDKSGVIIQITGSFPTGVGGTVKAVSADKLALEIVKRIEDDPVETGES